MLREIESILNESSSENLASLFCETLGWSQPTIRVFSLGVRSPVRRDISFIPIAQLSGLQVFRIDWHEDQLPNVTQRRAVYQSLAQSYTEHLICYVTNDGKQIAFVWARKSNGRNIELRTLPYEVGSLARTTIERINEMAFSLEELELYGDQLTITEVRRRLDKAFDVEAVTEKFFSAYCEAFKYAEEHISGIDGDRKRLFTQKLFNRLLFIRFLEKKGWLSFSGRSDYLNSLWEDYNAKKKNDSNFYKERLNLLFFSGLNTPNDVDIIGINKGGSLNSLIGKVPYLNGGLFDQEEDDKNAKIKVPDEAIKSIITDLFYRFNFTITETTPLNIEVAVDPEMLGRIFEKLVTSRHETGAYYTPKAIVSFMCKEAIKGYLGGSELLVDEHKTTEITIPQAKELLQKLAQIKVCDPACGSGAYLLGMLHELHELTRLLDTRAEQLTARDDYERKLQIIQNNLYGVDIDPFAANIACLRLWLALAVEYESDIPAPLPNLDFKIEIGDSLIAPDPHSVEMELSDGLIRQFAQKKAEHQKAHHGKKQSLYAEVMKLREQIRKWARGVKTVFGFDWVVEFAEVFMDGGFDIVIANPPYGIKCEDALRLQYFPRMQGEDPQSKDSYGLFMARGIQLLKPNGFFTFIVSDTWRTIRSHRQLRKRLLEETTVFHVLDLPSWIFDATVNTCILSLCKEIASEEHELVAGDLRNLPNNDWRTLEANLSAVAGRVPDTQAITYARYTYSQSLIFTYDNLSFFIGSPRLYSLMSDREYTRFGNIADSVHGISTGKNKKYIRAEIGTRGGYDLIEEWMKMPPSEIERITDDEKVNGVDKDWKKLRGCFVPLEKGGESDASSGWLPNYYVPTQYYINWSKGSIEDMRKNPGFRWINLEFFFKPGITFSVSGIYSPTFRLNRQGIFEAKGSGIFCDSIQHEILLAFLCSKVARYQFKCYIKHSVDTSGDDIKEFRFPMPDKENAEILRILVSSIINKQKLDQYYPYHMDEQREIDSLLYKLYELTEEDIREIELWYCRRYSILAEAQGFLAEVNEKYADHLARCEYILFQPPEYWKSHPILGLISQGEGQNLEFKETLEYDIRTRQKNGDLITESLKTVAAFLNTDGGTLLIGVSDIGEIKGIDQDLQFCQNRNKDGMERKIRDKIDSGLSPKPTGKVSIDFPQLTEGVICRVNVQASSEITHLNGDIYIRDGNRSPKLQGVDLTQWVSKRAKTI